MIKESFRKYLEEAAAAKNPDALCMLGIYHARGIAGEKNLSKMFQCFKKAADLGSAEGYLNLGRCYFEGLGVKKNYTAALQNFRKKTLKAEQ